LEKILHILEKIYLEIKTSWESDVAHKYISNILVFIFISSLLTYFLVSRNIIPATGFLKSFQNPFYAIELSFTVLLITEIISMLFVLPKSVAKSVTKQFELLSLIFLRHGFEQFSHIHSFQLIEMIEPVKNMFAYGFSSLLIYFIVGIVYRKQKHILICHTEKQQRNFVKFKRAISLVLLVAFLIIVFADLQELFYTGTFRTSFHIFFTVLIFSDILILLITTRYILSYRAMYRYSAFILATIFIRLALTATPYYDMIIGIMASVYLLLLVLTYNYFESTKLAKNQSIIQNKLINYGSKRKN